MPYKDPEKARAYAREARKRRYHADPVAEAAKAREWRQSNIGRAREIARENYYRHQEQYKEQSRLWQQANKHRYQGTKDNRVSNHKRRAQANGQTAGAHFTKTQFEEMCMWYEWECLCCHRVVETLTADHVVPLSKGGSNGLENIQPLCIECNTKKGTQSTDYRDPEDLGFLLLCLNPNH